MSVNLHARSMLDLLDYSYEEIEYLLHLAADLKEKKRAGTKGTLLEGKNIVLIFNKPSTRTRCACETAIFDEGGQVTFLTQSHMGHKESIEDTARVLGRMYDGIVYRGYQHSEVEILAKYAGIPVWNGLTDQHHPTQVLADLLTIREQILKPYSKIKLVFVGDARNNVATSLMIGAAKMGIHFVGLAPKTLWPEPASIDLLADVSANMNGSIRFEEDSTKVIPDADVIYTDVWVSMGEEKQFAERINILTNYQVNQKMLSMTQNNDVIFMHCLPAHHDVLTEVGSDVQKKFGLTAMEATDEVFRSHHSKVFDQAENRLHTFKALIVATIGKI